MGREIDVNMLEQYTDDMRLYSVYSALYRVVPDFRDGFKSVQRKIISKALRQLSHLQL